MTIKIWEMKEGLIHGIMYTSPKGEENLLMLKQPIPPGSQSILNQLKIALDLVERYIGGRVKVENLNIKKEEEKIEDNGNKEDSGEEEEEAEGQSEKEIKQRRARTSVDTILRRLRHEIKPEVNFTLEEMASICDIGESSTYYFIDKLIKGGHVVYGSKSTGKNRTYILVKESTGESAEEMQRYRNELL